MNAGAVMLDKSPFTVPRNLSGCQYSLLSREFSRTEEEFKLTDMKSFKADKLPSLDMKSVINIILTGYVASGGGLSRSNRRDCGGKVQQKAVTSHTMNDLYVTSIQASQGRGTYLLSDSPSPIFTYLVLRNPPRPKQPASSIKPVVSKIAARSRKDGLWSELFDTHVETGGLF